MRKILISTFSDNVMGIDLEHMYAPFVNTLREGLFCKYNDIEIKIVSLPNSEFFRYRTSEEPEIFLKKYIYDELNAGDVYIHISFNLIKYVDFNLLKHLGVNTIYYQLEPMTPTDVERDCNFTNGLPNEIWTYNLFNFKILEESKFANLCKLRCVYPGYFSKSTLKQTNSKIVCAFHTFKNDINRRYNFRVLRRRGTFSNFELKLIKWNSDKEFYNLTHDKDTVFSGIMLNMYKQSKLPRHRGRHWAFPLNTAMLSETISRGFVVVSDTPYSGDDESLIKEMELYRECGIFCCIYNFGNVVSELQSLALEERQELANNFSKKYKSLFSPKKICESLDII